MNSIYNIKAELFDIYQELEENGGELTDELEEQLAITQQDFTNQIKAYTDGIKSFKADIAAIDEEMNRLKELKAAKKKVIERLSAIIIDAIELFGDTNKSGTKFVDYGTGKVSIRNSSSVEVDEDKVNGIVDSYKRAIAGLIYQNQLKVVDGIEENVIKDLALTRTEMIGDEEVIIPINFNSDDLAAFEGKITFNTNFRNLLKGDHFKAIKAIIEAIGEPEIEASISKTAIKEKINDNDSDITIGRIIHNKNITIK